MAEPLLHLFAFDFPVLAPLLLAVGIFIVIVPALDRRSTLQRSLVTGLAALVFARYFTWRIGALLTAHGTMLEMTYSWAIFTLEILAACEISVFFLTMSRFVDRSAEADNLERDLELQPEPSRPRVDVLIPTHDEGPEVLERTIIAARGMHYSNFAVWVCDDGQGRTWLQELCRHYNVNYLAREDRKHAKAGNINNALAHTTGDLIAVFDADFAPAKNFLTRTVGFFSDPKIGLVQTPQHFFNRDPIQTNLSMLRAIPDEQRLFFDHMAPSRDAWNVAFCCGAGFITRRSALEDIGGVPTSSITEDLLTSLALLRNGHRTRYLNERLAVGLAPENMEAYVVQRRRWCRGAIQGLFAPEGPFGPGLSIRDRFLYFPFGWLMQHPIRLLMMVIPALYLLTGLTPYPTLDVATFLRVVLPLIVTSTCTVMWLVPGCYIPLVSTAVSFHTALHVLPTVISTLIKPFGGVFKVTPKGNAAKARTLDRRGLYAAIGFGGLTIAGMLLSGTAIHFGENEPSFNVIATVWGAFNLVICVILGLISVDRVRPRVEERFEIDLPVTFHSDGSTHSARLRDLSSAGACILTDIPLSVGAVVTVEVEGIGKIPAKAVRVVGDSVGLLFLSPSDDVRQRLIERLFAGDLDNGIRHAKWSEMSKGLAANFY